MDDRKPLLDFIKGSFGRLYAYKGYLSRSLKQKLKTMGIDLITNVRQNSKLVKHSDFDKSILRRRAIIDDSI